MVWISDTVRMLGNTFLKGQNRAKHSRVTPVLEMVQIDAAKFWRESIRQVQEKFYVAPFFSV